jgi:hypothetical protein
MRKRFTLSGAWKDIPHIIKSPLYGFLIGGIIALILPRFWNSPYTILVMREEIKDQMK